MLVYLVIAFLLGWLISKAPPSGRPVSQDVNSVLEVSDVVKDSADRSVVLSSKGTTRTFPDDKSWPVTDSLNRAVAGNDTPCGENDDQVVDRSPHERSSDDDDHNPWVVDSPGEHFDSGASGGWDTRHDDGQSLHKRGGSRGGRVRGSIREKPPHLDSRHKWKERSCLDRRDSRVRPESRKVKARVSLDICDFCARPFSSRALPIHIRQLHSNLHSTATKSVPTGLPISCEVCQMTIATKANLRDHKNKEHSWALLCTQCFSTFSDGHEALSHYQQCHGAGRTGFDGIQVFLDNLRSPSGSPEETSFGSESKQGQLTSNSGVESDVQRPHTCLQCWTSFSDCITLDEHAENECESISQPSPVGSWTTVSFPPLPSQKVQASQLDLTLSTFSNSSLSSERLRRVSTQSSGGEKVASIYHRTGLPTASRHTYTPDELQRRPRLSDLGGLRIPSALTRRNSQNGRHGPIGRPPPASVSSTFETENPAPECNAQHSYHPFQGNSISSKVHVHEHPHRPDTHRVKTAQIKSSYAVQSESLCHPSASGDPSKVSYPPSSLGLAQGSEVYDSLVISLSDIEEQLPCFLIPSKSPVSTLPLQLETESETRAHQQQLQHSSKQISSVVAAPLIPHWKISTMDHGLTASTHTRVISPKPAPIRGEISAWSTPLLPAPVPGAIKTSAPSIPPAAEGYAGRFGRGPGVSSPASVRVSPLLPPPAPVTRVSDAVTLVDTARRPRSRPSWKPNRRNNKKKPLPPVLSSTPALEPRFDGDEWTVDKPPLPVRRGQGGLRTRQEDDKWGGVYIPSSNDHWAMPVPTESEGRDASGW